MIVALQITRPRRWSRPSVSTVRGDGVFRIISVRKAKLPVTIRLDPEVVDWFQRGGRSGYQTRINKVLLAYVRHQKVRREKVGNG